MHPAVHQAISSLIADNKTPSVALVKSRLTEAVPMPIIISALTAYKNDPSCIEQAPAQVTMTPANSTSQLDRIEQKLDLLIELLKKD